MFKKKNELETNLFDKAMGWYRSGDPGKKSAAMDLFPESLLKSEIENYRKRDKKERLRLREETLNQMLEKAKKTFPIGSLIWSDDTCDDYPHLVVGEPYIGTTEYNTHIPYGVYEYGEDDDVEHKTVLVHTLTITHGEVDDMWGKDIVGLENLLLHMDKPVKDRYPKRPTFVDLNEYIKSENDQRTKEIADLTEKINRYQKEIDEWNKIREEWLNYNPEDLTQEKLKEYLKEKKW